jgi:lysophospholipase L1-like esterase
MKRTLLGITSWLLIPAAFYLGMKLRAKAPRQPPPPGPFQGSVGDGEVIDYRLLVLGDSSACGVGVDRIENSLAPQIASFIHGSTGCAVSWRIAGFNSATTEQLRDHVVPNLDCADYTHIVVSVGTNDMKNFHTRRRFKNGFGGLLYALHARWPDATIVWQPLLDMRTVPSFSPLLATIMQIRRDLIQDMAEQLCRERHGRVGPMLDATDPLGFSIDGFHASAEGYRFWAGRLADTIIASSNLTTDQN